MWVIARAHLESVCQAIGITQVSFIRQQLGMQRRADIYTLPGRGSLKQNYDRHKSRQKRYRDWADLDPDTNNPKIKYRIIKADQLISFVVELTHQTAVGLNTDFNNFIRNLGKFIYDGQTATYIDANGADQTDNKGNKIRINLGSYDFNDNKYYGDIANKVFINIEFEGNIFTVPDPTSPEIEIDKDWVIPETELA